MPKWTKRPMTEEESFEMRVAERRLAMEQAVRDDLGFRESDVSLTYEQVRWFSARLDAELDSDADALTDVDPLKRRMWLRKPEIKALYDLCTLNKREALRVLGSQLLPKALRTIDRLLDESAGPRANAQGLNFLLRTQGLLIDKQVRADPGELAAILSMMRAANAPTIIEGRSTPVPMIDAAPASMSEKIPAESDLDL